MRLSLIFILLLGSLKPATAQDWSLSTAIGASYSGVNHNLRLHKSFNRWDASIGPSFNYSKNKLPWSAKPGINMQTGFSLIDSGAIQSSAFFSYLLLPIQEATIHEVYVGYTMFFELSNKWKATNSVGFGGYEERADQYSFNGLSYCINFGLSYRL
mgnify:CR=1 FL=1|tara:strand:- start:69 stop:536 length:468 start_codon:yes stop_codon:yes gene_type:complete